MSFTKNNRTVFILGAGASYGDTLVDNDNLEETTRRIPLANQFFQSVYLDGEIDAIRRDYSDLLKYISANWNNNWPLGSGRWDHLNLEDVFTSLAIENEFEPSDTDGKAQSQLLLNSLKRYIRKLIGKHSVNTYGKFSRQLVQNLKIQDSIITFNYDLLIDEAFIYPGIGPLHYERFYDKLFGGFNRFQSYLKSMKEISIKIDDELYRRASRKVGDLEAEVNQHVTEYLEALNDDDHAILDARTHMAELFGATRNFGVGVRPASRRDA